MKIFEKRDFVIEASTYNCAMLYEKDLDKFCAGFEKIRIAQPSYGIISNPFPKKIQYVKKMNTMSSLVWCYRLGKLSKYWLFRNDLKTGWAID